MAAFLPVVAQVGVVREQFQNSLWQQSNEGILQDKYFLTFILPPSASSRASVDAMISLTLRLYLDHPILEGYSWKYYKSHCFSPLVMYA